MSEGAGSRESAFAALRRMARSAPAAEEQCDLCAEPIGPEHRHLLNVPNRELLCVCDACRILFSQSSAGGGTRRLVPTRCLYLADLNLTDAQWEGLRIPVNMAFFYRSTPAGRVIAMYPSPMGATESLLTLDTWEDLERQSPALRQMEPDVEALLVNRTRNGAQYFLVPIDECFKLVGLIRRYWKGFTGGREVWQEVDAFFAQLRARAGGGTDA